jgi:hypothetical protein
MVLRTFEYVCFSIAVSNFGFTLRNVFWLKVVFPVCSGIGQYASLLLFCSTSTFQNMSTEIMQF